MKTVLRDWSIDLETLGTAYDAPILSIGAVQFDRDTGQIGIKHYRVINLDSALSAGRPSASALCWWLTQHPDAKAVMLEAKHSEFSLADALDELATILRSSDVPRVWGNGATFDITILEHAFQAVLPQRQIPWSFLNIRDMRTTVDDAEVDVCSSGFAGVKHNALDDALYQAVVISHARRAISQAFGRSVPKWAGPPGYEREVTGKLYMSLSTHGSNDDDEL